MVKMVIMVTNVIITAMALRVMMVIMIKIVIMIVLVTMVTLVIMYNMVIMVLRVEMVIMVKMIIMVEIIVMVEDSQDRQNRETDMDGWIDGFTSGYHGSKDCLLAPPFHTRQRCFAVSSVVPVNNPPQGYNLQRKHNHAV